MGHAQSRGRRIPPQCARDRNYARAIFKQYRRGVYPPLRAAFLEWFEANTGVFTANVSQIGLTAPF